MFAKAWSFDSWYEQMMENEKEAGVKKLEAAAAKKAKGSDDESAEEENNA